MLWPAFDYDSKWTTSVLLLGSVLALLVLSWQRAGASAWGLGMGLGMGVTGRFPPTPGLALPIIGHLHLMGKDPRIQFAKWAKRLGPIFRLQFGSHTVVVLNGYDVLKQAFVRKADHFSDRPHTFLCDVMANNRGFVSSSPHWRKLRKVTVDILRQLGTGSQEMEGRIKTEVTQFLQVLRDTEGQPLDIRDLTAQSLNNIIAGLVFAQGFGPEDPKVASCVRMIGDQVSLMEGAIVLNFLPFLRRLPGDLFGLHKASAIAKELDEVLEQEIDMRRQRMHDGTEQEDFITGFLQRMEKHAQGSESLYSDGMDEANLIGVLKSLFAAGTETTSSTICWAVLYLLHHPEVLERCHREVQEATGGAGCPHRPPTSQDRPRCKYLEATIMETQRMCSISPFSIYHTASSDVHLNGFLIPEGSIIMPSLDSVLYSPEAWGDPQTFRPGRFLDEDSYQLVKREELIPFSLGKRACLGEAMAKQEMFLFLASLIQEFHITVPEGSPVPSLDYRFGLNCSPLPFEVCFVPR